VPPFGDWVFNRFFRIYRDAVRAFAIILDAVAS
jgi:hypothetical protein